MILLLRKTQLALFGKPTEVKAHTRRTKTGAVSQVVRHQRRHKPGSRLALIACSKVKDPAGKAGKIPARQLYGKSALFSKAVHHVESTDPHDGWFVLSAKHGLLDPEDRLGHYDKTLAAASKGERGAWAEKTVQQLRERGLLGQGHRWEIHAGRAYSDHLKARLDALGESWADPLAGKQIGERLGHYKSAGGHKKEASPLKQPDPDFDGSVNNKDLVKRLIAGDHPGDWISSDSYRTKVGVRFEMYSSTEDWKTTHTLHARDGDGDRMERAVVATARDVSTFVARMHARAKANPPKKDPYAFYSKKGKPRTGISPWPDTKPLRAPRSAKEANAHPAVDSLEREPDQWWLNLAEGWEIPGEITAGGYPTLKEALADLRSVRRVGPLRKAKAEDKPAPKKAAGAKKKPSGHFSACSCCGGEKPCKEHAHWSVKCSESGEDFTLRVPWAHRYDPHGWKSDHKKVTWKGKKGHATGVVVAEGADGVTTHDGTAFHRVRHGQWKPHSAMRKAAKAEGTGEKTKKHPPLQAGERWITVHPNGDDEKGVPVKISLNKDGTHSIVGGAGGKLNHLRLTKVKDPGSDEAKEQAEDRKVKKAAKKEAKAQAQAEKDAKLAPEQKEEKAATKSDLEMEKLMKERKFVEHVRSKAGGIDLDRHEDFDKVEKIKGKAVANRLRTAHHNKQVKQAAEQMAAARRKLVDHTIAEQEARNLIDKSLEAKPEVAKEARRLAQEQLDLQAQEDKERKAERVLSRQRNASGKGKIGERAAGVVGDKLAKLDPEKVEKKLAAMGGRDDKEGFIRHGAADEEIDRRAVQAEHDGLQLARLAKGEVTLDDLDPEARRGLEKTVGKKIDDPEAVKAAAMREAARKFRRAEKEKARASHYRGLEDPEKALAWVDANTHNMREYGKEAKRLGLADSEKEPLKQAEVSELVDLFKAEAEAKAALKAFKQASVKIDDGDYKGARDAMTIKTSDEELTAAAMGKIEDEVRTQLAQRIRSVGDQRDPHYVTAHARGRYDAMADTALAISGQRYIDRHMMDALGHRNASVLLRHALEQDGHDPKKIMAAVEGHHVETQAQLTTDALAKAEKIVPGLEHKVGEVGSIEGALDELDAHVLDVEDAQKAVGGAIGRMEGLATVSWAMKQKQPSSMEIGGPETDLDTSLAWLHASGLREGDYSADYKSGVVSIPKESWGKMITKEDPKALESRKVAREIKAGHHDEEGWLAPGIVSRTKSSFTDPLPSRSLFREAPDFSDLHDGGMEREGMRYEAGHHERKVIAHERNIEAEKKIPGLERERDAHAAGGALEEAQHLTRQIEHAKKSAASSREALPGAKEAHAEAQARHDEHHATHGDLGDHKTLESAIRDHAASRMADGEPAAEIAADLFSPAATNGVHPDHREHYGQALREVFPLTDEHGNQKRIEASADEHRAMVHDWAEKRYGKDTAHFHAQDLKTEDPKTHEAMFRALTENPAAAAAFKDGGDLTLEDRAAIRAHIETKLDAAKPKEAGSTSKEIEALGPEPDKETTQEGLFGGGGKPQTNPAWTEWNKARGKLLPGSEHHDEASSIHRTTTTDSGHRESQEAFLGEMNDLHTPDPDRQKLREFRAGLESAHSDGKVSDDFHKVASSFASAKGKGTSTWADYVKTHGSRDAAIKSARDDLKGDYLASLHGHWSRLHGEPLIAGSTLVHGAEKHALAMGDPTRAAAMRARQDEIHASLRDKQRDASGKFGAGSFSAEAQRRLEQSKATEQAQSGLFGAQSHETPRAKAIRELGQEPEKFDPNQSSMFGAPSPTQEWTEWSAKSKAIDDEHGPEPEAKAAAPAGSKEPGTPAERETVVARLPGTDHGDRISLGHLAESQIGSVLPKLAQNTDPKAEPINLAKVTGVRQDGKFIGHQRIVKMNLQTGRTGAFLATGGGKSLASFSTFLAHHDAGNEKHGLFITPSKVRDQFGGEIARFTKPGAYQYETSRGKSHAERVAMLANPDSHMRVITHEGMRDTIVKMVADHHFGGDAKKAVDALAGPDASSASVMSSVMSGWFHPTVTPRALLGTATPLKNDEREAGSVAALLDPHKYGTDADHKRADLIKAARDAHGIPQHFTYGDEIHKFTTRVGAKNDTLMANIGGHLPGSKDSMRRELDHLTYTGGSKPAVQRTDSSNPWVHESSGDKFGGGPLRLTEHQQKSVDAVHDAYHRIRTGRGTTDDAKALSPGRFADAPADQHDEIAKTMLKSSAVHFNRDHAYRRALNQAPPEHNAKVQAMTKVLNHDKKAGKRSIIFSGSVKELHILRDHLEGQGHKVGILSGAEDAADFKRRANPEKGDPEFDVALLSPAAQEGVNLQSFQVQHNFDVPETYAAADQRAGRIHRTGQSKDVEVHSWHHDHPYEHAALRRLRRKEDLSEVFQSPTGQTDDSGIAQHYERAMHAKHEADVAPGAVA